MKKICIILGLIAAILAVVLAATPLSKIAFIPSIVALIFGIIALTLSKNKSDSKKSIQLIFLMTIVALTLTTYKAVFNTVEVGDTKQLKLKEEQLEEESLQELDNLELNDIDNQ